jgi:prepilin-type N-terminal cleavage/methylation domain-containing protein
MSTGPAGPNHESGFSLIEVLISIVIMGITMTALLGAFATQIKGAGLHRDESNAGAVLTSAAEKIQAAAYLACEATPLNSYRTAARTVLLPNDWTTKGLTTTATVDVTAVKSWSGSAFVSTCSPDPTDTSDLLQLELVTVVVKGPGTGTAETLDIVKRKP